MKSNNQLIFINLKIKNIKILLVILIKVLINK